jgi:hypothetical protein
VLICKQKPLLDCDHGSFELIYYYARLRDTYSFRTREERRSGVCEQIHATPVCSSLPVRDPVNVAVCCVEIWGVRLDSACTLPNQM